MSVKYTPPQYADEATPRGALVRALSSEFPHSLPIFEEVVQFAGRWVLSQDTTRAYIVMSEAIQIIDNWMAERKALMS